MVLDDPPVVLTGQRIFMNPQSSFGNAHPIACRLRLIRWGRAPGDENRRGHKSALDSCQAFPVIRKGKRSQLLETRHIFSHSSRPKLRPKSLNSWSPPVWSFGAAEHPASNKQETPRRINSYRLSLSLFTVLSINASMSSTPFVPRENLFTECRHCNKPGRSLPGLCTRDPYHGAR